MKVHAVVGNNGNGHSRRQTSTVSSRQIVDDYFRDVSRYLADEFNFADLSAELIARGNLLRAAASTASGTMQDAADALAAGSRESSTRDFECEPWFVGHIDFAVGVLHELSGNEQRAEEIYGRIVADLPDGIGWPLWVCASHQLACLRIRQGTQAGLEGLCELLELSAANGHLVCGPTDYTFAEVLRYFLTQKHPHPRVSRALMHGPMRALWLRTPPRPDDLNESARDDGDLQASDWQTMYTAAEKSLRSRARVNGLGPFDEFAVLWPQQLAPWKVQPRADSAGRICCGVLTALGAQDIRKDFPLVERQVVAEHDRLLSLLEKARVFARSGSLQHASALVDQLRSATSGRDEFATLAKEAQRLGNEVTDRINASDHKKQLVAGREVLALVEELSLADVREAQKLLAKIKATVRSMPGDFNPWLGLVATAETEVQTKAKLDRDAKLRERTPAIVQLIDERKFAEAHLELGKWAADSPLRDELTTLIKQRQAAAAFQQGLEEMESNPDRAEAWLTAAAHLDNSLAGLVPAMIVASVLLRAGTRTSMSNLAELGQYRAELRKRAVALARSRRQEPNAAAEIWELIREYIEQLLQCTDAGDPVIDKLVESLCAKLDRCRSDPPSLTVISDLLLIVLEKDPAQAMIGSATYNAELRLSQFRHFAEGEKLRVDGNIDGAADEFRLAIRDDPRFKELWHRLIDCRLEQLTVPKWRKIELAEQLRLSVDALDEIALKQFSEQPDDWIEAQLQEHGLPTPASSN